MFSAALNLAPAAASSLATAARGVRRKSQTGVQTSEVIVSPIMMRCRRGEILETVGSR